jgi:hypothetical protein
MRRVHQFLFAGLMAMLAPCLGLGQAAPRNSESGTAKLQITQCVLKVRA